MTIKRTAPPRRMSVKREAQLKASGKIPFSTILGERKPVRKSNPERKARKTQQYRKGLAAYRKSETYKAVEKRAGGRCEFSPPMWGFEAGVIRCPNTRADVALHHHHLTYARFGGAELPEDIQVLCTGHHEAVEAKARPHNRGRKLGSGAREGGV